MNGQTIKLRVSSIGNVFYTIRFILIAPFAPCNGTAPTGVTVSNITTSSADVNWAPVASATYIVRYKKVTDAIWSTITSTSPNVTLLNLLDGTAYEVQEAAVCSGIPGAYSASANFTTTAMTIYCTVAPGVATDDYISNVTVANVNKSSSVSTYTSYMANPALQINLTAGSSYTLSVTRAWLVGSGPYSAATSGWIDFNRNGVFEDSERILTATTSATNPATVTFAVPSNAVLGLGLRMRVGMLYTATANQYIGGACGTYTGAYGEFEDYNVEFLIKQPIKFIAQRAS